MTKSSKLSSISSRSISHLYNHSIIADLPDQSSFTHIASTDLRPDIVMWNDINKSVILIELTVCFETNFAEAHQRKVIRYLELEEEIRQSLFRVGTVPIQVGCRGFSDIDSFYSIKQFLTVTTKEWNSFLKRITEEAIIASHRVWSSRSYRSQ